MFIKYVPSIATYTLVGVLNLNVSDRASEEMRVPQGERGKAAMSEGQGDPR